MSEIITTPLEVNKYFKGFFSFKELRCKCGCKKLKLYKKTAEKILQFRILYNKPFTPRSVYRCQYHKKFSLNHNGWAQDIPCFNKIDFFDIVYNLIAIDVKRIIYNKKLKYVHWDISPYHTNTYNEKILDIY